MPYTYTPFVNGESASSIRTKINNLGEQVSNNLNLKFGAYGTNISVPVSSWVSSDIHVDYPYQSTISLSGVLETDISFVMFAPTEQDSGNYTGSDPVTNGVVIYATEIPVVTLSIPAVFTIRQVI